MTKMIKVLLIVLMGMVASFKASAQFWGADYIITFSGGGNSFIPVGERNSIVSAPAGGGQFGIGTTLEGFHEKHFQELTMNYAFALSGKRKVGETPNSYKLHTAFLSWQYFLTRGLTVPVIVVPYIGLNIGWGQTIASVHSTPSAAIKSNNLYWAPKIGIRRNMFNIVNLDLGLRYDLLGQNRGVGVDLSLKFTISRN